MEHTSEVIDIIKGAEALFGKVLGIAQRKGGWYILRCQRSDRPDDYMTISGGIQEDTKKPCFFHGHYDQTEVGSIADFVERLEA